MQIRAKRVLLVALSVASLVMLEHLIRWGLRERQYSKAVDRYAAVLKPRVSRGDVERYLKSNGIEFSQECSGCSTLIDLVQVGMEERGWLCSQQNVYAAFRFAPAEIHDPLKARESDRLVRISKRKTVCLDLP